MSFYGWQETSQYLAKASFVLCSVQEQEEKNPPSNLLRPVPAAAKTRDYDILAEPGIDPKVHKKVC